MAPHSSTLAWKTPMDREAWWAAVHGVTKSRTRLSDFTFIYYAVSENVKEIDFHTYNLSLFISLL